MSTLDAPPADESRRYPVGRFAPPTGITPIDRERWITSIATLPQRLRALVEPMTDAQLATPYRPGGWTVRQVVHHVADSHMNALVRVKLALTEAEPTIKPYDEAAWAVLADVRTVPVGVSLALLDALHARWVAVLRSLTAAEWARTFVHPEHGRATPVEVATAMYAWHSEHHLGHVTLVAGG